MKSFRLKIILSVLFLVTVFFSCSSDDDQPIDKSTTKSAFVTEIRGPESGKVNDELSYEIFFTADNECGQFDRYSEVIINKVKGLQVEVRYPAEACSRQVPTSKIVVFKFKSTEKGTFEIKFKKSKTEFITRTVVVSE